MSARVGEFWTLEEVRQLREMRASGAHVAQIASTLDRTRGAVSSKLGQFILRERARALL